MNMPDQGAQRRSAADAIVVSIPIDIRADSVNSDVVSAIARWRHVDGHGLHALASALWTQGGVPIEDSPGYLSALHGFVAEKVAYDDLSQAHHIVWPEQTNVPAYDMIVDGAPMQIKEGTTAYQQVQHASSRYSGITSFVTDPATAEQLRTHGLDAIGIDGLDPGEIASSTRSSVLGLEALENTGQLHIPLLTTVFAICKYWERYDAEKLDLASALKFAATDIGAQSIGAAAGLKLAAVYVVATGGFGIAALPLTAGAMLGAMGLRHVVGRSRGRRLREAVEHLDLTRAATEVALEIIVECSRGFAVSSVDRALSKVRETNAGAAAAWVQLQSATFERLSAAADPLCRKLMTVTFDGAAADLKADFSAAFAESDLGRRFSVVWRTLMACQRSGNTFSGEDAQALAAWIEQSRDALNEMNRRRSDMEEDVNARCLAIERETRLDLISEYALLLHRLAASAEPTAKAIMSVQCEAQRIGVA